MPSAPWRVTTVSALPGFRLHVTFVDGTTGEVDLREFLERSEVASGVFAPLREIREGAPWRG